MKEDYMDAEFWKEYTEISGKLQKEGLDDEFRFLSKCVKTLKTMDDVNFWFKGSEDKTHYNCIQGCFSFLE